MKLKNGNFSRKLVILISVFLLAMNGFLGTALMYQSKADLSKQMQERMLDILKSAGALLDGDVLANLKAEDRDTEPYKEVVSILRAFQENFNLSYIYGIRAMNDGTFTFTIDPDPENPGDFGETVKYTDALYAASKGIPSFDKVPYQDRWGRFYSAYNPVFDSKGNVGGIIAVDINADWYESQLWQHLYTTLIISAISLIAGGTIVFLLMDRLRKRLNCLNQEMVHLTDDVEELAEILCLASARNMPKKSRYDISAASSSDVGFEVLGRRLNFVRKELQRYINDAHTAAYTDMLTGIGNRNAYIDMTKSLDAEISASTAENPADFSVAIFDINGLKQINDSLGHEYGDFVITSVSEILKESVHSKKIYRIGGDEFVVILEHSTDNDISKIFRDIEQKIEQKNSCRKEKEPEIAVSKGFSTYQFGKDADLRDIFHRADNAMYADKADYYSHHADRRRKN